MPPYPAHVLRRPFGSRRHSTRAYLHPCLFLSPPARCSEATASCAFFPPIRRCARKPRHPAHVVRRPSVRGAIPHGLTPVPSLVAFGEVLGSPGILRTSFDDPSVRGGIPHGLTPVPSLVASGDVLGRPGIVRRSFNTILTFLCPFCPFAVQHDFSASLRLRHRKTTASPPMAAAVNPAVIMPIHQIEIDISGRSVFFISRRTLW